MPAPNFVTGATGNALSVRLPVFARQEYVGTRPRADIDPPQLSARKRPFEACRCGVFKIVRRTRTVTRHRDRPAAERPRCKMSPRASPAPATAMQGEAIGGMLSENITVFCLPCLATRSNL